MDVCKAHDAALVCYEGRHCPVCQELDDLTGDLRSTERSYADAVSDCEGLEAELTEIQDVIADFPEVDVLVKLRRRQA